MALIRASNALLEGVLTIKGNPERKFEQLAATTLSLVSKPVSQLAANGGARIAATDSIVHLYPHLVQANPRGWATGTWSQADGIYSPYHRMVAVAQYRRESNGNLVETNRAPGVLLHEFAHGLDHVGGWGWLSRSAPFVRAYLADFAGVVGKPVEKKLHYYVQGFEIRGPLISCAGLEETFAELFASAHGHSCQRTTLLVRSFPRTAKLLREFARGRLDRLA